MQIQAMSTFESEVSRLATALFAKLDLNASLDVIEERVWTLKCYNMPDEDIADIIEMEYGVDTASQRTEWAVVEVLPERFQREDWS